MQGREGEGWSVDFKNGASVRARGRENNTQEQKVLWSGSSGLQCNSNFLLFVDVGEPMIER